jgi:lipopolysaccharide transport system permease protein
MKTASVETALVSRPSTPYDRAEARARSAWRRRAAARAGLVWTLVRTDFKARYHGTLGGFVWALLKPLCMFAVLMSVFSFVFTATPTYKLDLIIGLFLWDFFAEGTKTGLTSLHAKAFLLTKARCPSWILVVASISNALITLAVFAVVIAVFLILSHHALTLPAFALFLSYCAALVTIVIGFSLAASVLFLRYRDLNQIWDLVTQAGFFIAPIIWPIGIIPERFHAFLYLWPPTPIIAFSRAALVTGALPTARGHVYLAIGTAVCFLAGFVVYRTLGRRAAEYV